MSAREYVDGKICRKIHRALNDNYPRGDVKGYHEQKSLVDIYLIPELDAQITVAPHVPFKFSIYQSFSVS